MMTGVESMKRCAWVGAIPPSQRKDAMAEIESLGHRHWGEHTLRQTFPGTAHHDTESIYLRWAPEWTVESIFNSTDAVDYPARAALPAVWSLVERAREVLYLDEIGRVMVVKLKAGGKIDEHRDEGLYAEHFDRYHIPLKATPHDFIIDGHPYFMSVGGIFWFNHHKNHQVINDTDNDRIHLIIDAVSNKFREARRAS